MSGVEIKSNEDAWQQVSADFKTLGDDMASSVKHIETAMKALDSWKGASGDMARQICLGAEPLVACLAEGFLSMSGATKDALDEMKEADEAAAGQYKGVK